MTFLNPLVLFGLIAATIPIIIHLLNLRRLKVVEFSSIQFLKEMQKNKMRKIRIKQILLLILRTLAIIFLVLSFSRPTIKNIKLGGLGSEVKNSILIFIDDTPSMLVSDKRGEYISQAKKIATSILEMAEEGDEIYLMRFSDIARSKNEFNPISKNLALREVENINTKDISANFVDVFLSTSKILEQTKNLSREIYIITDFQKSNLPHSPSNNDLKFDKVIDSNTRIYFFKIGEKEVFNISIDSLNIINRIFEINKPINISASISNHTEQNAININSSLYFNEKRVAQKGIDLAGKSSGNFSFVGQTKDYGFISGKIEIEEDDLLKDNVHYFNFHIPAKVNVLLVSESTQDLAFTSTVLSQSLDDNSEPMFSITNTSPQFFNSYKLENFNIIFISSPEKISNLNALKKYLSNGGLAVILPGPNSNPIAFGRTLEVLGLNQINGVNGSKESITSFTRFKEIDFNHTLFNGIFTERSQPKVESPKVFYSFNYKPTLKGKEIISLENNYSFLCEEKIAEGSILLFLSAFDLKWNEFPLKPLFVPLILRIALYSNSLNQNFNFIAGHDIQIKLKNRKGNHLKLIYPDGKERIITKENYVQIGILDEAGNYKLLSDDSVVGILSVNVNADESILEKLEDEAIYDFAKNSFPQARLKIFSGDVNPVETIKQERYGTELWKLFLILVILCLIAEMIIAKTSGKDLEKTS